MHNKRFEKIKCFNKIKCFKKTLSTLLSFFLTLTSISQTPKASAHNEATPKQINEINRIKENAKNEIHQNIERQKRIVLNNLEKQRNEAYSQYERAVLEILRDIQDNENKISKKLKKQEKQILEKIQNAQNSLEADHQRVLLELEEQERKISEQEKEVAQLFINKISELQANSINKIKNQNDFNNQSFKNAKNIIANKVINETFDIFSKECSSYLEEIATKTIILEGLSGDSLEEKSNNELRQEISQILSLIPEEELNKPGALLSLQAIENFSKQSKVIDLKDEQYKPILVSAILEVIKELKAAEKTKDPFSKEKFSETFLNFAADTLIKASFMAYLISPVSSDKEKDKEPQKQIPSEILKNREESKKRNLKENLEYLEKLRKAPKVKEEIEKIFKTKAVVPSLSKKEKPPTDQTTPDDIASIPEHARFAPTVKWILNRINGTGGYDESCDFGFAGNILDVFKRIHEKGLRTPYPVQVLAVLRLIDEILNGSGKGAQ